MRIKDEEVENLKRQISAVQEIEGWFPLISDLMEFMESQPGGSDYKVICIKAFYRGTTDLMKEISFDKSELSKSIEAFKYVYKKGLRDCLVEFSEKIVSDPVPPIENLITAVHKFKRKKILEGLGGEKLTEWEELILDFYSNEIENLKTISTIKPFVIGANNKSKNRKYNGEETQLEGYSHHRWALVLWYENNGRGIPAKPPHYRHYQEWKDVKYRTEVNRNSILGTKEKIEHYKWAIPQITNAIQKKMAEGVLQNLENELNEIKNGK
jgi:hypothetical protein